MRIFTRIFIVLFLVSSTWFLFPSKTYAQGEFKTDYKVQYTIDPSGTTSVTQQIVLTNNTANFYADKFDLKIGSAKIENVQAKDSTGPMQTDVKFEDNTTTISVKFNQRVIGQGKTLPWQLSYTSQELAQKSGAIWEVSIPKVADSQDIGTYDATVTIPKVFGPVAFTVPEPQTTTDSPSTLSLSFNKSQLTESGIAMSFGDKQIFSFNLKYFLQNNNLTTQVQSVSIPPDNNYQRIALDKIDPAPQNIDVDADGNFLAKYKVEPNQSLDVTVSGSVEVFSKPSRNLYSTLSKSEREIYTQPQKYWEVDNAFIKDKANELKTAQNIYDFTVSYLKYSQNRKSQIISDYINLTKEQKPKQGIFKLLSIFQKQKQPPSLRKGAAQAVLSPNDSICLEFTDLFIALARAANIPAREVDGYAYTQNERLRPLSLAVEKDVLHSWPQYWDENLGWVQVDPTWGSTSGGIDYFNKMDFNHITFVQKGLNSETPYPPGTFRRREDIDKNLVQINFAQDFPNTQPVPQLELYIPKKIIAGIPAKSAVTVKNSGASSIVNGSLNINSDLEITGQNPQEIDVLPPLSQKTYQYRIQPTQLGMREASVSASLDGTSVYQNTKIVPIYFLLVSPGFGLGLAVAIGVTIAGFHLHNRFHLKRRRI